MSLGVASRRDPYPYDVRIDGLGLICAPDKEGNVVSRRVQPLQAQPTSYEYSSNSPFVGSTYEFRHLVLGAGENFQPSGTARRYKKTIKVDASLNGRWIKGPHFHAETIRSGQPIRQFIRGIHAGADTLFALAGRYLYRRVSDNSWALVSDAGVGNEYRQAALFQYAGASAARLYITRTTGNLSYYDGTSLVVYGPGDGPEGDVATNIAVNNKELWIGAGNLIQKVEADPMDQLNWAATIRMGDGSSIITWMEQNKDAIYTFKENGVYTLSAAGAGKELYPSLRGTKHSRNGINAAVWNDDLYVPFRDTFFRIDPLGEFKPIGMEQMLDTDSEIRGYLTGFAGHETWFGYETLYNELDARTHLMKYGTWIESEDDRSNDILKHVDVHHGSIADWGKEATRVDVIPMPGTNDRLYVGFADGTCEWAWLPKNSPNPTLDPLCEFTTSDGYMYGPDFHAGFAADRKIFQGFSAFGPKLDNNNYAVTQFRLSESGAWEDTDPDQKFTVSGQRIDFTDQSNVIGRSLQHRTKLFNASTTDTPVLDGIAIHSRVRPAFILQHKIIAQVYDRIVRRDGTLEPRSAQYIKDFILNACSKTGTVRIKLPEEEEQELTIEDYEASLIPRLSRYGAAGWNITIQGIQFKSLSTGDAAETLSELTYGELEQYTYGQLEALL